MNKGILKKSVREKIQADENEIIKAEECIVGKLSEGEAPEFIGCF